MGAKMAKKNVETGLLPQVHYQMLQEPLLTWVLLSSFRFSRWKCVEKMKAYNVPIMSQQHTTKMKWLKLF